MFNSDEFNGLGEYMERLTVKVVKQLSYNHFELKGYEDVLCKNICNNHPLSCSDCPINTAIKKLAKYENLEEKLEKVYGECDGLLETAVDSLLRHEGAEIGTPAKARLLTDEDVDEWFAYKEAKEQGLLVKLPIKPGDTFWELCREHMIPTIYPRTAHTFSHCFYCLDHLGDFTFVTEDAAKEALEKEEVDKDVRRV